VTNWSRLVLVLILLLVVPALVLFAVSFGSALVRDIRGKRPEWVNMQTVADVVGSSRWPNVVWWWHRLRDEAASFRYGARRFTRGVAIAVGVLLLIVVVFAVGAWISSGIPHLSIPTAIIVGALIVAVAISSSRS
jgi:hypothetical protein